MNTANFRNEKEQGQEDYYFQSTEHTSHIMPT